MIDPLHFVLAVFCVIDHENGCARVILPFGPQERSAAQRARHAVSSGQHWGHGRAHAHRVPCIIHAAEDGVLRGLVPRLVANLAATARWPG